MKVEHLTHCPGCRYELRGLPAAHRCPECGFAYDEHTMVWQPAKPWKGFLAMGIANVLIVLILLVHLWRTWRGSTFVDPRTYIVVVVGLSATLYIFLHLLRLNRKCRCVAILPAGVFIRSEEDERLIPWTDVSGVSVVNRSIPVEKHEYIAAIKIRTASRDVLVDKIFASEEERASFVSIMTSRLVEVGGDTHVKSDGTDKR